MTPLGKGQEGRRLPLAQEPRALCGRIIETAGANGENSLPPAEALDSANYGDSWRPATTSPWNREPSFQGPAPLGASTRPPSGVTRGRAHDLPGKASNTIHSGLGRHLRSCATSSWAVFNIRVEDFVLGENHPSSPELKLSLLPHLACMFCQHPLQATLQIALAEGTGPGQNVSPSAGSLQWGRETDQVVYTFVNAQSSLS